MLEQFEENLLDVGQLLPPEVAIVLEDIAAKTLRELAGLYILYYRNILTLVRLRG
jgi:hypothetical protein